AGGSRTPPTPTRHGRVAAAMRVSPSRTHWRQWLPVRSCLPCVQCTGPLSCCCTWRFFLSGGWHGCCCADVPWIGMRTPFEPGSPEHAELEGPGHPDHASACRGRARPWHGLALLAAAAPAPLYAAATRAGPHPASH